MKSRIIPILILFIIAGSIFLYQFLTFNDGKFHVVFCDVGQGDAILIRTPGSRTILIDSGPNEKVMECLSRNLPFYKKSIDLAILSHPHEDHLAGFLKVFDSYVVKRFATEKIANNTPNFKLLQDRLAGQNTPILYLYQNDKFIVEKNFTISILAPSQEFVAQTSPDGKLPSRGEFASIIPLITYGKTQVLLTGDSQSRELLGAIQNNIIRSVDVLQVPHHGSKTGLSQNILNALNPKVSVISVGAVNRYNLPNPLTISLLQKYGAPFYTTKNGDVQFVSDGESIISKF